MGMVDQVYRLTELEPLGPRLQEIQGVIDRARNPSDGLTEDEALSMIARLAGTGRGGPTYQKPWG